jgi:hypothetical protein
MDHFSYPGKKVYTPKELLTVNCVRVRDSLQKSGLIIQPGVKIFRQNFVAGTGGSMLVFAGKNDLIVRL